MKIQIWGCRGSLAAPGPETVRYGGNTSCVELRLRDGTLVVLDAGTGIRKLGAKVAEEGIKKVHLLLTHLHLDHLEGIGFFTPIWDPEVELNIWGPPSPTRPLAERVATLFAPPLFPEHISDVPSQVRFHDFNEGVLPIDGAKITVQRVAHRGPTVAYRVEENGSVFAYIPDHEPARGEDIERTDADLLSGLSTARDVDLLFHDAQYSEEEYPSHSGWGHSSIRDTVSFGRVTGAKQVVMFHHDPRHSDEQLEVMLKRAEELWGSGDRPVLAHEGFEAEL